MCYDVDVNKNCSHLGGEAMALSTKHFKKRDAIYNCLRMSKAHPSAEELFTQLKPQIPDLSIGTVYRNLTLFKQEGMATSVATVKGVERFDANTDPHVHFICNQCDAVLDLDEICVPQQLKVAAEATGGCRVHSCQLSFTGICGNCLEAQCHPSETA